MRNVLTNSVAAGGYVNALRLLIDDKELDRNPAHEAFRRHFPGMRTNRGDTPCLILEASANGQANEISELLQDDKRSGLLRFLSSQRLAGCCRLAWPS